ncbi:hypothetical protein C0J52_06583 [Blattella germanica]|nr:hypothetical protein C0J52_06583 [Blattella germanica]
MSKTSLQLVDHENIARMRESVLRSPKRSAKRHAIAFKYPTEVFYTNFTRILYKCDLQQRTSYGDKVLPPIQHQTLAVLRDSFPGRLISRFRDT